MTHKAESPIVCPQKRDFLSPHLKSPWFEVEPLSGSTSRRKRIIYAIRGGLSEKFIKDELNNELEDDLKEIIKSINLLSKYTHVNEKTIDLEQSKCEEYSEIVIDSFVTIFELISDLKYELQGALHDYIGDGVLYAFIENVFDDLGILSWNTFAESSSVESFEITVIDNEKIYISGDGYVDVSLNYCSGDDATEISDSFPFDFKCNSSVSSPKSLEIEKENINVDTSSWYE